MVWAVSLSTTKLSPRRLTLRVRLSAIRSLVGFGKLAPPSPSSLSTCRRYTPKAAPKCISGRTSYLRVRLAFHPYPQLIQQFCNTGRFGPPSPFKKTSPWPWVAHPVSGPIAPTISPYSDSVSLSAPQVTCLARPLRSTRRFILQ
jgi:hypothetical protein